MSSTNKTETLLLNQWLGNDISAREDFNSDNKKIDDWAKTVNTHLNENTNEIKITNKQFNPDIYDGCMVTFIDDDGAKSTIEKFKTIADEKNIKFCSAIVKTWVGTTNANGYDYMTLDEIKSLQNEGHDILNHTKSHINNWDITLGEIRSEINENKEYMKANGLNGYDIVVYPGTVPNYNDKKRAVRDCARYGISNTYIETSGVLDNYYMPRIDSDFKTLDQLKTILDNAILNKQWLIVLSHSWRQSGGVNDTACFSEEKISQFIDYIKSKNVPIRTFLDAEKYKGNVLSIGNYSDNSSIYISKDSKHNLDTLNYLGESDFTKNRKDYKEYSTSFEQITTPKDNFYNIGGTLITYNFGANFTFQLYHLWKNNRIYKRLWNNSSNSWGDFIEVDSTTEYYTNNNNSILMDAPITNYQTDKETIITIPTSLDTFLGVGGTLKIHRSSRGNFSYSEFIPWNEKSVYHRKWQENAYWGNGISVSNPSWGQWIRLGGGSGESTKRPSFPPLGYCYFDTTLNKPVWYNGTNWVDVTGTTA